MKQERENFHPFVLADALKSRVARFLLSLGLSATLTILDSPPTQATINLQPDSSKTLIIPTKEQVETTYLQYLGRPPSLDEIAIWTQRDDFPEGIISSPEAQRQNLHSAQELAITHYTNITSLIPDAKARQWLGTINVAWNLDQLHQTGWGGVDPAKKPRIVGVTGKIWEGVGETNWYASSFAHEAVHVVTYDANLIWWGVDGE